MVRNQFRVLYHEFLFRLVDREVLSISAQGDASKLLARLAAILVFVSLPFGLMACVVGDPGLSPDAKFELALLSEHTLVATNMLIVGLFAVLTWDSAYPQRLDLLVLGPLPVRASTIFCAKTMALALALSLTVITFNAVPGLLLPFALAPHTATILDLLFTLDFYRPFGVYWLTMLASGTFVFCCVLIVQGVLVALPRRAFLQLSAVLQIGAFCLFVAGYLLEPALASTNALTAPENQHLLRWLPSYWFLALFPELHGWLGGPAHPALIALAHRAWIGLAIAIMLAAATFVVSYVRTLRKIVEQPDIVPGMRRVKWLPRFGNAVDTAVTQFSIRTLLRSRQHRVLLSFYVGIGFAIVILFTRAAAQQHPGSSTVNPWRQVSLSALASNILMTCFWILGIRVVAAIPLELRANWIFRLTQIHVPSVYLGAGRRAMYVLGLAPVLALSAGLFLCLWPWQPAVEHLAVLTLVGVTLIELAQYNFHKLPFTCSYLPGKSNLHITFAFCLLLGVNAVYWSARMEYSVLADRTGYLRLLTILLVVTAFAWWRRARAASEQAELRFEEELAPVIGSLGLHRDGVLPTSST